VTVEPVLAVPDDTEVLEQDLYPWKHQGFIERGLEKGTDSSESATLRAANKRIKVWRRN